MLNQDAIKSSVLLTLPVVTGSLMERIQWQVKHNSEAPAVIHEQQSLSYRDLNEQANRVAKQLVKAGVLRGMMVPLCMEKSIESVISMLAILKLGAAYVPLDPAWPLKRINDVLSQLDSPALLVKNRGASFLNLEIQTIAVDFEEKDIPYTDDIYTEVHPDEAMYVLFTSGSTGKPKGVIVPYGGIINRFDWLNQEFGSDAAQAILQLSKHTFDVSIGQIFWPLTVGGTTIVPPTGMPFQADQIGRMLAKYQVQLISMVPSLFGHIVDELSRDIEVRESWASLKFIWIGGEEIVPAVISKCYKLLPQVQISNHYGPTETSIACLYYKIERNSIQTPIPIGKPLPNVSAYILGDNNDFLSDGETGEIAIGGVGLSLGYLNDPTKTASAFIELPYQDGTRLFYKTGDAGRIDANGEIIYAGRLDQQVKLRGQRIELNEIEHHLRSLTGIRQAIVAMKEDHGGHPVLIGYYVADNSYDFEDLKSALTDLLPDYMIPNHFVELGQVPLNANGKIDRDRLPIPNWTDDSDEEVIHPATETEAFIEKIWCELLGATQISTRSHFFNQGGNSLKAMKLASYLQQQFGVSVPVTFAFHYGDIQSQATFIDNMEDRGEASQLEMIEVLESTFDASSQQKRLFMVQQHDLAATTYNVPGALYIEGELDLTRFQNAVNLLVLAHESLRTSFKLVDGQFVQIIESFVEVHVEYVDENSMSQDEIIKAFIRPFDLEAAPLFRLKLCKTTDNKHLCLYDFHHIVADGVSIGVVLNELFELYGGGTISPARTTYRDYTEWQNRHSQSELMLSQELYWTDRFADELPVLQLPYDYNRPPIQSFEGGQITTTLDTAVSKRLIDLATHHGATLHMVLISAFYVLLAKYARQEDIVIGTPVAGRTQASLEKVIGMFVNTLPIRNYPSSSKTFLEFLNEVRQSTLGAYDNQEYPLETLLDRLQLRRDLSRNPLFDVLFVLQNMDSNEIMLISQNRHVRSANTNGLQFHSCNFKHGISKFDLLLEVVEHKQHLFLNLEYASLLFAPETAKRLLDNYCTILESILSNPQTKLSDIRLIQSADEALICNTFNQTDAAYESDITLHTWLERQSEKTPDLIAVHEGDVHLTYAQLNVRANQLARKLRELGVAPDVLVPVLTERSIDMLVAIYAVLKAGGAYVPIDPSFPDDRIAYIVEDTQSSLILGHTQFSMKVNNGVNFINIDDESHFMGETTNLTPNSHAHNLAYVIYTSGSTGRPKGVMIEHYSVVNRLNWMQNTFPLTSGDVILQKTPFTFDVSVWELFWWSKVGASVVMLPHGGEKDAALIASVIEQKRVSVIHFVPSMLTLFFDYLHTFQSGHSLSSLRYLFTSGEALHTKQVTQFNTFIRPVAETRLINLYGPTEATVDVTWFECNGKMTGDFVPIGKPIDNTRIWIVDEQDSLVHVGQPGELCIAGDGVARGYLNLTTLTREKFVPDLFDSSVRMYRTGDLAQWMPDGNIRYLGRLDDQVKIRGYRIELGEIQAVLHKHEAVKDAAVVLRESAGERYLCGFFVALTPVTADELKSYLSECIPSYMVPAYLVELEVMPLTPSGKIDRKKLPDVASYSIQSGLVAPQNEGEALLLNLYEEVLNKRPLGINSNFFEEGGHSLKAAALSNAIYREMGIQVPLSVLFKQPTVAQLGEWILSSQSTQEETSVIQPADSRYKASSVQKRLFILGRLEDLGVTYNMPGCITIEGNLDAERMKRAVQALVDRHESLRTSFRMDEDDVELNIEPELIIEVPITELGSNSRQSIMDAFVAPFDLGKAPLFRAQLLKETDSLNHLLLDIHHIVCDGISFQTLLKDLFCLYDAEPLPSLDKQFKEHAYTAKRILTQDWTQQADDYWQTVLEGELPVLQLPADYERPPIQSHEGNYLEHDLPDELADRIRAISHQHKCTPSIVLLAAYFILLHKYTDQDDLIVGTAMSGRVGVEYSDVVGMFVNTLPIRTHASGKKSFLNCLDEVKDAMVQAMDYQLYPLEKIIEASGFQRDLSRNPLFDTMFIYNLIEDSVFSSPSLRAVNFQPLYTRTAKFDLTLEVYDTNEKMSMRWEYASRLFHEVKIQRMAAHFTQLLENLSLQPEAVIETVSLLTQQERVVYQSRMSASTVNLPSIETVQGLFEQQVREDSDRVAIYFEEEAWTFGQLNQKANQVAHYLREVIGVAPNDRIGVSMAKSLNMMAALLGVLKAGAAYVPIDPAFPEERKTYILNNSACKLAFVDQRPDEQGEHIDDGLQPFDDVQWELYSSENAHHLTQTGDLMYVIYTSGSTGNPKGVMVTHRNVLNFFEGMNQRLQPGKEEKFLSVTTMSFDISVLELFWTLTGGIEVVLHSENEARLHFDRYCEKPQRAMEFSLFFFSSYGQYAEDEKYKLVMDAAKYADKHGYKSVWIPERHFHEFGGLFANPAVMCAALASVTERVELRAGSVVSPLQQTPRIAEEWSMVDNLSGGRVGVSFASGWHVNDFVLNPNHYSNRKDVMFEQIHEVQALWSGEKRTYANANEEAFQLGTYPRPVQPELPIWVTAAGSQETFVRAGEIGANLLTHLLGQDIGELEANIQVYQRALEQNGYDPNAKTVTLMIHTFMGTDLEIVKAKVKEPFIQYLRSSADLMNKLTQQWQRDESAEISIEQALTKLLEAEFERYWQTAALIGTKDTCQSIVDQIQRIGVTEIACLVDFGLSYVDIFESLDHVTDFKDDLVKRAADKNADKQRAVTMMQSTPSRLKALVEDPQSSYFLRGLRTLLVGGEAFPADLVHEIQRKSSARIHNMYGPTETTIWSTTYEIDNLSSASIPIGTPILNTQIYIVDKHMQPVPDGVMGEICIGGEGVTRGYWQNEALTSEKFATLSAFGYETAVYRTGDLGCISQEGLLVYMGRKDHQVKLNGYRIELGEIENALTMHPAVKEVAVMIRENTNQDRYIAAYIVWKFEMSEWELREYLRERLPEYMIPSVFVFISSLPLTPNGKIDRKALPEPDVGLAEDNIVEPQNQLESDILAIWRRLFNRDDISVTSDFFSLGGHSLLAIRLEVELEKRGLEIEQLDVFRYRTIRDQAAHVSETV